MRVESGDDPDREEVCELPGEIGLVVRRNETGADENFEDNSGNDGNKNSLFV